MPKAVKSSKRKEKTESAILIGEPLQEFCGYKVLPILVGGKTRHYMYFKKHTSRTESSTMPQDQTLFVSNLPADSTKQHLVALFGGHNAIVRIIYHESTLHHESALPGQEPLVEELVVADTRHPKKKKMRAPEPVVETKTELRRIFKSGSSAHVIFKTPADLEAVLNMTYQDRKWSIDGAEDSKTSTQNKDTSQQPLGFKRYLLAYDLSRPDKKELQSQVDEYMMKFKANEYEKEREMLERMSKMDEDGFVVVTSHKRAKATDGKITVTATSEHIDPRKLNKNHSLSDFYRFQVREQKKNELSDLRKRFEEDKAKIQALKQARKFKPY